MFSFPLVAPACHPARGSLQAAHGGMAGAFLLDYVSIFPPFVLELAKRKEYTIGRKPIVGLLIALIGLYKNIPSRAANSEGVARESGDFSWQGIVYHKHRDGTSA